MSITSEPQKRKDDYLTVEEYKLLDTLLVVNTLKAAARKLGISYATCRVRCRSIRQKRVRATNTVNRLNNYSKRDIRLAALIAPIKREAPQVEK